MDKGMLIKDKPPSRERLMFIKEIDIILCQEEIINS